MSDEMKEAADRLRDSFEDQQECLLICAEKAPQDHLMWMFEDETGELIPRAKGLYYELTYDHKGRVCPTMVVRNSDDEAVAGVQLSTDELMKFAQWAFKSGVSYLQVADLSREATVARSYVREQLESIVEFIHEQQPQRFQELIAHHQLEQLQRQAARVARETEATVRVELATERQALELRYAQHIVELSRVATMKGAERRDKALTNPVLQDVITKAVQTVANRVSTE